MEKPAGPSTTGSHHTNPQTLQPSFQGEAGEYFRIWIVNMLLSILTLGIYSAWATVRNRRYLYGSTELDGDYFDFHGKPLAILRGRIFAVIFFAAYAFGGDFHPVIPMVAFFILMALFPWILVKAMRFRLSNTSWRNLRFGFGAATRQVYSILIVPLIVTILTYGLFLWVMLGAQQNPVENMENMQLFFGSLLLVLLASLWIIPVFNYRVRNLVMNSIYYGDQPFQANIQSRVFFTTYLKMLGMAIVVGIAGMLFMGAVVAVAFRGAALQLDSSMMFVVAVTYIVMILFYLLPFAVWQVLISNHVISTTRVRRVVFNMEMKVGAYWWLLVSNAFAAVLTIGLAIPWAKIRMIRYKLSCLEITGDVNSFSGSKQIDPSATGDEIGDAFDIDFGF